MLLSPHYFCGGIRLWGLYLYKGAEMLNQLYFCMQESLKGGCPYCQKLLNRLRVKQSTKN